LDDINGDIVIKNNDLIKDTKEIIEEKSKLNPEINLTQ